MLVCLFVFKYVNVFVEIRRVGNQKIMEKQEKREEKQSIQKLKIGLQRKTLERRGKAVRRGRLTPGAQAPDGETAESSPGK